MSGIVDFEAFLLACIMLNITPGNDTIFILSRSLAQGKQAGMMSVLGISTGCVVHTLLAALGLSVVIAQSPVVYNVIKYAGAAYIAYVGLGMFFSNKSLTFQSDASLPEVSFARIYRDAVITNVLNPKVALFFIAFLPQFIDPTVDSHVVPFLILGFSFTTTGTLWCILLVFFASLFFIKLKDNPKLARYINKVCGFTLVGLGIKVALADRAS